MARDVKEGLRSDKDDEEDAGDKEPRSEYPVTVDE